MADKKSILEEAQELIHGARQASYGPPIVDFSRTAKLLTGLLSKKLKDGEQIEPEEVALIQVCVKLSRLIQTPGHHDSMVDIPGYMGTYEMVMESKQQMAAEIKDEVAAIGINDVVIISGVDSATAESLQDYLNKQLEKERYHQNLRAMNINPKD